MEYIGNILYDKQLYDGIPIVIYGAGGAGKKIIEFIRNNECGDDIKCICDKNSELWGKQREGINIMSPKDAADKYRDAHFLICGKYADEMLKELIAIKVSKIHLVFC